MVQRYTFGRNSVAGVINLITKRPTDEFEGSIRFEGGSWDKETVQGAIKFPDDVKQD